jgi:hypothetical protein
MADTDFRIGPSRAIERSLLDSLESPNDWQDRDRDDDAAFTSTCK